MPSEVAARFKKPAAKRPAVADDRAPDVAVRKAPAAKKPAVADDRVPDGVPQPEAIADVGPELGMAVSELVGRYRYPDSTGRTAAQIANCCHCTAHKGTVKRMLAAGKSDAEARSAASEFAAKVMAAWKRTYM